MSPRCTDNRKPLRIALGGLSAALAIAFAVRMGGGPVTGQMHTQYDFGPVYPSESYHSAPYHDDMGYYDDMTEEEQYDELERMMEEIERQEFGDPYYYPDGPIRPVVNPEHHIEKSFSSLPTLRKKVPVKTFALPANNAHMAASSSSAASQPPAANACQEDGLEVCRCYCRVSIPKCENNHRSYVSNPLCPVEWDGNECSSIGYFDTSTADAYSCSALERAPCEGYIRNDSDTPDALTVQKVQGSLYGCGLTAL